MTARSDRSEEFRSELSTFIAASDDAMKVVVQKTFVQRAGVTFVGWERTTRDPLDAMIIVREASDADKLYYAQPLENFLVASNEEVPDDESYDMDPEEYEDGPDRTVFLLKDMEEALGISAQDDLVLMRLLTISMAFADAMSNIGPAEHN